MKKVAVFFVAVVLFSAVVTSIANAESIFQQMYDAIKGDSSSSCQDK